MTKWLIAYRRKDSDKWYKYCYANTQAAVVKGIEKMYASIDNIECVQIKKVVV